MKCAMMPSNGGYKVVTPFDWHFINDLKTAVPASDRAYDPQIRCWTVSAQYKDVVARLIEWYFAVKVNPQPITVAPVLGIIEVLYLGKTKDRGNGLKTAKGWTNNGWTVTIPEPVLKRYFDPCYTEQSTVEKPKTATYYETLSIKQGASPDEIKSGYRRMVKQWHPDVCKDPDATEVFRAVQKAYEILSNPKTKARYDVGLKLAEKADIKPIDTTPLWAKAQDQLPYRSPLKCGNLLCEYTTFGVMMTVSKIMQWEDIYNEKGQVLVSSWKMGDDAPTLEWR